MHSQKQLAGLLALAGSAFATSYTLQDSYTPETWADNFTIFNGADASGAYVKYLDAQTAYKDGLLGIKDNAIYLGVDHTNVASGAGRNSVRLQSKNVYNRGLIVADIGHMPADVCGTWPAFWTAGGTWPADGEVDMIEGVNIQDSLETALHLGPGCKVNKDQDMIGTMTTDDCYVFSSEQPGNQGCVVKAPQNVGYGRNFNKAGGAVLATEITKETVTMWYFARGQVPAELKTGAEVVDTSKWGKPMSIFHGDCDFEEKIKDQIIIFNTAFCGDWAKNRWESSGCSAKAATCEEYVQNNPEAFKDVYWSINWMKVYQQDGNAPDTPAQPKPKPQSVQPSAETHSSKAPAPKITLTQATASSALSQAPAPETTTEAAQCTPQPRSCTTYVTKSTITKIATGSAHEKRAAQTLVPARG